MNISLIESRYGPAGVVAAEKIVKAADKKSLKVSYEENSRVFVLLGSHEMRAEEIQKLFNSNKFQEYIPVVQLKVSEKENEDYLIILFPKKYLRN